MVGIADRVKTIVEMFAIGLAPTGSKDPYALRRAGNGIVRVLAEAGAASVLSLADMAGAATAASAQDKANEKGGVLEFMRERLNFICGRRGICIRRGECGDGGGRQ